MKNLPLHLFADVGGTFTDCLFWRPPGSDETERGVFTLMKILSSGGYPVTLEGLGDSRVIPVTGIAQDPVNFWRGATLV
ncbi:hypothetical protein JXA80_08120, partial [bacterium]|nr:hypothetical protein [candidate division CSSED10-310 bacterium]